DAPTGHHGPNVVPPPGRRTSRRNVLARLGAGAAGLAVGAEAVRPTPVGAAAYADSYVTYSNVGYGLYAEPNGIAKPGTDSVTHGPFGVMGVTDSAAPPIPGIGAGVFGASSGFYGVYGRSNTWDGVSGQSTNRTGVSGVSTNGTGVSGVSTNGDGATGSSEN